MEPRYSVDPTTRACLLFLCFVVATACLYFTRNIMAPFALAVFLWLIIDAFARWLDSLSKFVPYPLALFIAVLTVIVGIAGVVVIIADTAVDVAREAPAYEARISEIFALMSKLPWIDEITFESIAGRLQDSNWISKGLTGVATATGSVLSNFGIISLYVAFLFVAQNSFPKKMDDLFPDAIARGKASKTAERIRHSVEKYISVQTVISLLQTILSYIIMVWMGLDNALFWALVIFIFNYIPIVGGLAAFILPAIFALVQFDFGKVALLAGLLFAVQTVIANTLQPKMMGDSMNLSAIVVILSITLWGALWGGVGAFLSAPLTVIIMIILAQFPSTRWISVLLSADGNPDIDPDDADHGDRHEIDENSGEKLTS